MDGGRQHRPIGARRRRAGAGMKDQEIIKIVGRAPFDQRRAEPPDRITEEPGRPFHRVIERTAIPIGDVLAGLTQYPGQRRGLAGKRQHEDTERSLAGRIVEFPDIEPNVADAHIGHAHIGRGAEGRMGRRVRHGRRDGNAGAGYQPACHGDQRQQQQRQQGDAPQRQDVDHPLRKDGAPRREVVKTKAPIDTSMAALAIVLPGPSCQNT